MTMENQNSILLNKLNRFLFFSAPSPLPPQNDDNLFTSILTLLKQWLTSIPSLFTSLLDQINKAFPPETRARWLAVTGLVIVGVVAVIALVCCMSAVLGLLSWVAVTCWNIIMGIFRLLWVTCRWIFVGLCTACSWAWAMLTAACCCCGRASVATGKMMVAPGTAGLVLIERAAFEAAPKLYFASLRAG